jgi:hypothetical protein
MYPKFFKSTVDYDNTDVVYYLTFDGKNFYDITDYESFEVEDGVGIIKMGVWRGYYKEGDDGSVDITQLLGKSGKRNIEEVNEDDAHSYDIEHDSDAGSDCGCGCQDCIGIENGCECQECQCNSDYDEDDEEEEDWEAQCHL